MNCGPLSSRNELEMATPSTKDIPVSIQGLLKSFMEALDTIDDDKYSDISFHPIEYVNGEFEFDISELLADHDVTGVDLIWTSSTHNSCRFAWAGNDIKLHGRRINSYVFFDFDHLLAMERSSKTIKVRMLPSPNCPLQVHPTDSYLVIYRNLSKGFVYQKLEGKKISRPKRDSKTFPPIEFANHPYKLKKEEKSNIKFPRCHLVPWTVDFIHLQLNTHIVAPVTYQANACQMNHGPSLQTEKCKSDKPSNYERIREIYSTELGVSLPGNRSCRPSKYGSLTMLFLLEGILELRIVPKMRVLECDCML